jgi:hypothetical protein
MIATRVRRTTGIGVAALIAALGFAARVAAPVPAAAGVFIGFGFPIGLPGYYPPYPYPPSPYYPSPYPPPDSYPPPPSYQPSGPYSPP